MKVKNKIGRRSEEIGLASFSWSSKIREQTEVVIGGSCNSGRNSMAAKIDSRVASKWQHENQIFFHLSTMIQ